MSLKKRLIPKIQVKTMQIGSKERPVAVTTLNFSRQKEIGDPISQAKIYEAQAVDELLFIDIEAWKSGKMISTDLVRRASETIFMPFTVGGGVKSVEDFRELLNHGADKVCINSSAISNPDLISSAAEIFGSQCVVVSIDYSNRDGKYRVMSHGGSNDTGLDPVEWASDCEARGAGEILITSVDRDGTRGGLDTKLTREISDRVKIPVITAGGCGSTMHFIEGFLDGHASAVSAGTFFSLKDENPMQARSQIRNAGVPIRLET